MFGISVWTTNETGNLESIRITLDAILEGFAQAGQPVPYFLTKFIHDGVRYSFEDFDTLSAALRELNKLGIDARKLEYTVEN